MDKTNLTVDAIVAKSKLYDAEKIEQRDNFSTIQIEKIKLTKMAQISVPNQPISKIVATIFKYEK